MFAIYNSVFFLANQYIMEFWLVLVCILIVIGLMYRYSSYFIYGPYNTTSVADANAERYRVHRAHGDQKAAAALLAELNNRSEILISHLREKYVNTSPSISMDNTKNNRIDVLPTTSLYSQNAADVVELMNNPQHREYIQERIIQLVNNYNPDRIYEISPRNSSNSTSYTENKRTLILCLRRKTPNAAGENELHDVNTIMFVMLHELSHMMNNTWDHGEDFWILFKFILLNAVEAGIYQSVNYKKYPINYCGLVLEYNPLNDSHI
jgi:hypothetical protein